MAAIRGVFRADSIAGALTIIEAQMKLAGWSDDGAPTATILVSAADSEGRQAYIKLRETATAGGICFELGSSRSGDDIKNHGGTGAGRACCGAYNADRWFTLTVSDRWVNYYGAGTRLEYTRAMCGIYESPMSIADDRACLFYIASRSDAMATVATSLGSYGSNSNHFATNIGDTGWAWFLSAHMSYYSSAGTKSVIVAAGGRPFAWTGGAGQMCYPWWICGSGVFTMFGYIKDAILVHNLSVDIDIISGQEVIFNGSRYYEAGNSLQSRMGNEENIVLYLKGGAV